MCATNVPSGADLWIRTAFSTKGPFGSDTNVHLVWPLLEMNQNQREATRSRRAAGTVDVGHTPAVGEGPAASGKAGTRRLVDATCDQLWSIQDVAAFLGVPVATLYQWRVRHEGPPAMKLGKHLRFDPRRVREWAGDQSEDHPSFASEGTHGPGR